MVAQCACYIFRITLTFVVLTTNLKSIVYISIILYVCYALVFSNTWSSNGVTTEILGGGNISCSSTHLTSFCVLTSVVLTSVQGAVVIITALQKSMSHNS